MAGTVSVKGLNELNRAFRKIDKDVNKQIRTILAGAAEPVKRRAEQLAVQNISHLHQGDKWSQMRVGVTSRVVYVAPKRRGSKGYGPQKRPAFGPLLMDEAMEPALESMIVPTMAAVEVALDRIYELGF